MNGSIFFSELAGTAMLTLLGCGVVANVILAKTKGFGGGTLMINFGWGIAVFIGVYTAFKSGGALNPAVTIGQVVSGAKNFVPGYAVTFGHTLNYIAAQMIGAFIGAVVCWLAYKDHFDTEEDAANKLGVFSTGPEIRNETKHFGWNLVTEVIATFVLVIWVLLSGKTPTEIGPLAVAFVVVGIGASLGGPTGYAINPARDLGPRIAHAILPIKGKGDSDWQYSWVPVVGPILGAVLAGLVFHLI
ncbi:MAG: MIP/aquaporin family protein [Micrococcaceae bacterium]